jgi:hypothetical protein
LVPTIRRVQWSVPDEKRPIVDTGKKVLVGFDAEAYENTFG